MNAFPRPPHNPMGPPVRIVDPVRAAALHEAVAHVGVNGTEDPDVPGEIIAIATRFERYLAGEDAQ